MESIKKDLILLGIDPSLLPRDELSRLKELTEALGRGEKECLAAFLRQKELAEEAHDAFLDALGALLEKTEGVLLSVARLPVVPARGFSASCAQMLIELAKARETSLASLLLSLNGLHEELATGESTRRSLEKEHSVLSLALRLCKTVDTAIVPIHPSVFGDPLRAIFLDLSAILGDADAFLSELALSAARIAKKVDKGEASPTEYGRLIEGARIRLHDLSVNARHLRKETDHVTIHTRP